MTSEELFNYIECGHEIEWNYQNKRFSITFFEDDTKQIGISFCEFYKPPIDVYAFEELIHINYNGVTVMEMLESLGDEEEALKRGDLDIY